MKNPSKSKTNGADETDTMENNPLHELFLDELADIYNAERQLTQALPKLADAAQSPDLKEAFKSHLKETKTHLARLEQVAKSLGESIKSKECKALKGLVAEGEEIMEEHAGEESLDAALILAAQKVEHYEIATYGGLRAWAEHMGHDKAAELLEETLAEEKTADEKLTEIAETIANAAAEAQAD